MPASLSPNLTFWNRRKLESVTALQRSFLTSALFAGVARCAQTPVRADTADTCAAVLAAISGARRAGHTHV